jgi:hypothetical protein
MHGGNLLGRPSTVAARTSISSAAASSPSSRMIAGRPGLFSTECRAGRSSSSTAETGCGLRRITASQAVRMSGKKTRATGLERVFDDGLVGDARDEAERAFGADHQVARMSIGCS